MIRWAGLTPFQNIDKVHRSLCDWKKKSLSRNAVFFEVFSCWFETLCKGYFHPFIITQSTWGGNKEWCRTNQITINAKSHISTVTWMSRTELTSSHTSRICSIISSENPADRSFPRRKTSWLSESLYSFSSFFTFSLWTEKLAALKAFSDCACWCY